MATDWKDLLGALKDSEAVPVDNTPDPVETPQSQTPKAVLRVVTDRKGRKGKTATIVEGFDEDGIEAEAVARKLKQKLGTGGSSRGGEILVQGDRKAEVTAFLKENGYEVKG